MEVESALYKIRSCIKGPLGQHPYLLRDPKYHLTETIRTLIEVHWRV